MPGNVGIDQVVALARSNGLTDEQLVAALVEREELMADFLRTRGSQLGAMPAFVAEALAEIGMGRPLTSEHREYVHRQYHAVMDQLMADHPELFRQSGDDSDGSLSEQEG